MSMRKQVLFVFFFCLFLNCKFEKEQNTDLEKTLRITCTTGIIADLVKNIVGSEAQVTALMGPGVDPHLYKATQGDLKKLNRADIIIYNGLHLEGKMGELFEKLKNRKTVMAAADGIPNSNLINTTDFQGAYDPHIWFDVSLWMMVGEYLTDQLAEQPQLNGKEIRKNSELYLKELNQLHQWVQEKIDLLPPDQSVLITAHDAFGYFGRAYGIQVKGLQGISTLSEYGLKDISDLVNFIVDRKIKAVFVESSVSDRALNAVVEGCRSKGHEIEIGGSLFSDALGAEGTAEGTYLGMVKHNVTTIVENLNN